MELCQPALCCSYVPANTRLSCLTTEHRHDCEIYRASCQHLQHQKAAAGSLSVDQACSTQSLTTAYGVQKCQKFCTPYKCCFDGSGGSGNCARTEAQCADHGACATLLLVDQDGFDSQTDEAKDAVDAACQTIEDYDGQTQCTHVYNPALCCFLSDAVWHKPCSHNCSHYESCAQLYGPMQKTKNQTTSSTSITFSIPHQLERTCSPAQLVSLKGVKECLELCQHHLCCFDDDDNDDDDERNDCLPHKTDECHLYSACRQLTDLVTPQHNQETTPEEACAPSVIEQDGPATCVQSCRNHLCCFLDPRFEASCSSTDASCRDNRIAPCRILAPRSPPLEDPALLQKVQRVCTPGNLKSVLGATECENDCSQRGCCIEMGAGNCQTTDARYCQEVGSCQSLFDIHMVVVEKEEPTPQQQTQKNTPSTVTQKVARVCDPENLKTLSGYHNCYDQCYYHLCCFNDDPVHNCQDDKGSKECTEYAPCVVLVEVSPQESDPVSNLVQACSYTSVTTAAGLRRCRQACSSRLCCFQDPNLQSSCIGRLGKAECASYDSCKILVSDARIMFTKKKIRILSR